MSRAAPEIAIDLTAYAALKAEYDSTVETIKTKTNLKHVNDPEYLALTTEKQKEAYLDREVAHALLWSDLELPHVALAKKAQDAIARILLKNPAANYGTLKASKEYFSASALLACLALPELIKNSIDANATTLTIVLNHPETLIIDNGEGITDPKILAQCDSTGFCNYDNVPTDGGARIASVKSKDASKTGGAGAGLAINNRMLTDGTEVVALVGSLLIGSNTPRGAIIKFKTTQKTTFQCIMTKYQMVTASMDLAIGGSEAQKAAPEMILSVRRRPPASSPPTPAIAAAVPPLPQPAASSPPVILKPKLPEGKGKGKAVTVKKLQPAATVPFNFGRGVGVQGAAARPATTAPFNFGGGVGVPFGSLGFFAAAATAPFNFGRGVDAQPTKTASPRMFKPPAASKKRDREKGDADNDDATPLKLMHT
ncbi:MAG: ATP-binding protein [Coxiellaceae bacterium]|nr:ATP-binding protein [Coxiellaceae bacterium]